VLSSKLILNMSSLHLLETPLIATTQFFINGTSLRQCSYGSTISNSLPSFVPDVQGLLGF
jgi:hypothetical protein